MPTVDKTRATTLPAIHPNAGVAEWYRATLDLLLQSANAELISELTMAWSKAPPGKSGVTYSEAFTVGDMAVPGCWIIAYDAPSTTTAVQRVLQKWGDKWSLKFDRLSVTIARKFAAKNFNLTEQAMRDALKKAGFTVAFKPTRASIESYRAVVAENVGLIKSIPSEYLTDVQSQVWRSVTQGSDMATLSTKLQQKYAVTTRRAALIARDQNAKAKATIEKTRRLQLGIKKAIWQHSAAGKEPRPTHVAMNGKPFDLERGMYDKDEGEFVQPGELINCRCTSRAIIPGLSK